MTANIIVAVIGFAILAGNIAVMTRMLLVLDAMQDEARQVALNLAKAQQAVDHVAADLAQSHDRADASKGPPGDAGDAAARSNG